MAVVATLSKGYDLDYIWGQVDRGPAKDAASYYLQASEIGGEPPGRWWRPAAKALGFEPGERIERDPYDLLFGERKAPDGIQLGRPPANGRKAADLYAPSPSGTWPDPATSPPSSTPGSATATAAWSRSWPGRGPPASPTSLIPHVAPTPLVSAR